MKMQAIAAGVLMAAAAATASAQIYYGRSYNYDRDPYYSNADSNQECWNPRARHFERVRPGEAQDDLDFSRCRMVGYTRPYNERYVYRNGGHEECWNPRAGHFEEVRPNEYQGDLDHSRCRIVY
jgi:hypothetical protein